MTLDELLTLAREVVAKGIVKADDTRLSIAVLDLLGEALPCGFEPPHADPQNQTVSITDGDDMPLYELSPGEARAFAAAILRAADECEVEQ